MCIVQCTYQNCGKLSPTNPRSSSLSFSFRPRPPLLLVLLLCCGVPRRFRFDEDLDCFSLVIIEDLRFEKDERLEDFSIGERGGVTAPWTVRTGGGRD